VTPASADTLPPVAGGALRARWQALAARERSAVLAAAIALGLALVWLVAVQPAWRTLRDVPAERARLEAQWQTMQQQAAEARALRATAPLAPGLAAQSLQAATERLGESGRLSLQGERAVLTLSGADGAALLQWLGEARQGARAQPVELRLARDGRGWSGTIVVSIGSRG
jgi:general secretion pathway protein M